MLLFFCSVLIPLKTSFAQTNNPSWTCTSSGQKLVDASEGQEGAQDALDVEQNLHITAARRQLDTLAQLEDTPGDPGIGL